ncbi:MAG: anaerobic ribonucleoside-triphosphate reductase activating protein [Lachnospiraceae bacterium]|nr:anaerobic ribonucleoside-triphosphate reductase activating protein [Lachnospiraceae bacterium]
MNILGLQKLTLLDFPGYVAAIVFLGGCNFRCPFCQNSPLVLAPEILPVISWQEFFDFLHKRSGILEGICVTGGEPTLHSDLPEFLASIKSAGYLVKLDTNGTNPEMLSSLIRENLVDYVAMDIKAGRSSYARVCGLDGRSSAPALLEKIMHSVDILKNSGIDYEFRTTVVKGLHDTADFEDIRTWLSGCRHYYLQSFRDCPEVLQPNHSFSSFSEEELRGFLEIVQEKIPQACLRGI